MTWARYISMLNGNFNLPPARIVHSDRVARNRKSEEPDARKGRVRICGGALK